MSQFIRENVKVGDRVITLETGRIAKQAHGSCLVTCGESIVLVTVCGTTEPRPGIDFLPLSVEYVEKTFAAGKIPGGFFKREGRLRDAEILVSRLIDRPCRPLFPDGYRNEVQVIATVLSFDQENPTDVLAMLGASAALHMSAIPWAGPIGGLRVGRVDGKWVANPTYAEQERSDCELVVAASKDAIVMVEGEADEMSESDLVEALWFGKNAIQPAIQLIEQMREAAGSTKWAFTPPAKTPGLADRVAQVASEGMKKAINTPVKHQRYDLFKKVKKDVVAALLPELGAEKEKEIKEAYEDLKYVSMREQVLTDKRRVDGRDFTTVRPISIEMGLLPRVHGSTLFTRGETQGIVTTTLGTTSDEQRIDALEGNTWKRFLLHYNFPAYSVGEVKPMRGPGRREIGHGNLAERSLAKMVPGKEEFPYTIRIVSEITESNGSSSMATVCGGTLSLMDAGVPIKAPVAGVAMGLIAEGDRYAVLTDILGDEDHLGDMDFKVCGTKRGVTGIQMDIKISGLSRQIMEQALAQAKDARLHILDKMLEAMPAARPELSKYAPRITTIKVKPDQIRLVIGPGGKTIKGIVEATGAQVDIEDDGTVHVASADPKAAEKALEMIRGLTTEPEVGKTYKGIVKRVEPYGAFLEIMPGTDGLCHISDFAWERVEKTEDVMNLGDEIEVQVTDIDQTGRVRLSRKALLPKPEGWVERPAREPREGRGDRDRDRGPHDRDRGPRDRDRGPRDRDRGPRDRGPRDDRPRDDRPRDDRPRDDRPREDRPRDDRPRDDRPREDRPREDRPREDRPRDDRPRDDRDND
ncbi:Polyribonucleotide nucleotidyltransferase [Sandaracinus amylolyticus]|nr:polyribonucleotide nucleotidyltransferase [Sandaracinus amylolyticus]UJR81930.1 Polyribonucleotide nucleotidyltransferase [Sandaracinus amylolyticus]